jgi:diguanylate cyclase (GGDEF)-like protein/PAS domain S-box-containing protein
MPHTLSAVDLIRKYQALFKRLDHQQIAKRLVELLAAHPGIERAALLLDSDGELQVDAVALATASHGPSSHSVNTPLARLHNYPVEFIDRAFNASQCHYQSDQQQARALIPIKAIDAPAAAFYLEGNLSEQTLRQAVDELQPLWLVSALMVRQICDSRELALQRKRHSDTERALWASETYLNTILRYSPALIAVKDLQGNVVMASDQYKQLATAYSGSIVGKPSQDVYPPELAQSLQTVDITPLEHDRPYEVEVDLPHKDGSLHTYLVVKFPLTDPSGEMFGVCIICTDVSDRKLAESALREQQSRLNYMAFHDALTSLPNRSLFYDRISHGLVRSARSHSKLALLLLDIDRFKVVNDSLGHDAGDILLKAIAERLNEGVRDMDTVARLGGDEFVVVLEGVNDIQDVRFVANKLLTHLARPLDVAGHEISITASIGISVYPDDGEASDELLKNADIAMYKAKEAGKNNCQFYTAGMSATAVNYLLLENDLRRAIELEQLTLHYQPQLGVHSSGLTGVESLVRWQHPERGLVSPAHFIPLAEETGLIVPLGEWVLRAACQQQKAWLDAARDVPKIAVNVSTRQFRQRDFPSKVAAILRETGLPAEHLELEITESCAMEHAGETINQLNQLHQMGLSLSIDDFGTGYSSLAYLKRFPINKLKIDGSFVHDLPHDASDAAIAKSIIALAHNMQLIVVAEGVEHPEQAQWLSEQGCDQVQGFYYAKPMPASSFNQHFTTKGEFSLSANVVNLRGLA